MKKYLAIILCCLMMLVMVGCAQIINTETEIVKATIVEVDRDPARPSMVGKVTVVHPADYDILLKYGDIEEWIDVTEEEYYKYETLVGTTIDAMLVTDYYDDDTVKQRLELVKE